ncbi:ATPase-AAA-core domain-containing protein [Mycena venus]|uniref:ATPase-AAA-core domain-containing protein n=1 Tax=Mycena venus TaxID=2733690 RepID=A0A8H6YPR1_9AGAR|nr:ATPase-AAA-core domain-containing protein [Mycena venus]
MPPRNDVTQLRLKNIAACLDPTLTTLGLISDTLDTPFLRPISNTVSSLLTAVQNVRQNKAECIGMMEHIHKLLYSIICLHISSDTGAELSPSNLQHLGKFTETLHKIYTFVEAQQEKSRIKQFFRQSEMAASLKDCHAGLAQAFEAFKIRDVDILSDAAAMKDHAWRTHQEVLELISTLSDTESFDRRSSISGVLSNSFNSTNSLSLLPSEPKIFHGRESEISDIVQMFGHTIPKIAILGPGGMGKTSLAKAVLHHPEITIQYNHHRIFVACNSVSSSAQLSALIGSHIGLKPGKDVAQQLVRYFADCPPVLLILDNFETVWEPMETRCGVESLLSSLTSVDHLALIITMRGAERPRQVQWTRPYLAPLKPLMQDAARQTFMDIADDGYSDEDIAKILLLTDNMPLAIDLIAHLVDCEGIPGVLDRWETERTKLLSDGLDKRSNLDLSISLSLESPRLKSQPHCHDLLSLLSLLPDGLSDVELLQSGLPLNNILACKAALICTSLAYTDDRKRLKALVPIREYMLKRHPPRAHLLQCLHNYFHHLLQVFESYRGKASNPGIVARISSNLSNIQHILSNGLNGDNPHLVEAIYSTCLFSSFSRMAGHGYSPLMDSIPHVILHTNDRTLQLYFITHRFETHSDSPIFNPQQLVERALDHFPYVEDSDLKCKFYNNVANYYRFHNDDIRAMEYVQTGLSLARSTGNTTRQSDLLYNLAHIECQTCNYSAGSIHAYESQRLAKVSSDLYREAAGLKIESSCCCGLGHYGQSITSSKRARDLLRLCGLSGGGLDHAVLNTRAEVHYLKSEYGEAAALHRQMLPDISDKSDRTNQAISLLNMATIGLESGDSKHTVQQYIATARPLFAEVGYESGLMYCDMAERTLVMREGDTAGADALIHKSLQVAWGKEGTVVEYCLEKLGDLNLSRAPSTWTVTFLAHAIKMKQKLRILKALQFLGDVFLVEGDNPTAYGLFTVALEGFTQMDVHRHRAEW